MKTGILYNLPWFEVFCPCCIWDGQGGYSSTIIAVQAESPEKAEDYARRMLPRGWDYDDCPNVTLIGDWPAYWEWKKKNNYDANPSDADMQKAKDRKRVKDILSGKIFPTSQKSY